jgi:hypothetical protein
LPVKPKDLLSKKFSLNLLRHLCLYKLQIFKNLVKWHLLLHLCLYKLQIFKNLVKWYLLLHLCLHKLQIFKNLVKWHLLLHLCLHKLRYILGNVYQDNATVMLDNKQAVMDNIKTTGMENSWIVLTTVRDVDTTATIHGLHLEAVVCIAQWVTRASPLAHQVTSPHVLQVTCHPTLPAASPHILQVTCHPGHQVTSPQVATCLHHGEVVV